MEETFLKIDINLSQNLTKGDYFELQLKDNNSKDFIVSGTFTQQRLGRNQIELGNNISDTNRNIFNALKADYGNEFDVVLASNHVTMTSRFSRWQYIQTITQPANIGIVFNPQIIEVTPFVISSVEFLPASSDRCSLVKVRVTTTLNMTSYCINQNCTQINSDVVEFDYSRGATIQFNAVRNSNNIQRLITTPHPIVNVINFINVSVIDSDNGATAIVYVPFTDSVQVQYSLDNINWQPGNTFSGLLQGNYIAYVKDEFGCNQTKSFTVLHQNFSSPVVFISKENSFRFIEPFESYNTDENRSFCKSAAKLNYGYIQEFLNTDMITTQFRSNFQQISVNALNITDNTSNVIPLNKITNNIGLKTKYNQVKKYRISANQFGLYFVNGQILDYDTNALVDTYNLNGSLPLWAMIGNVIQIAGVSYYINSIGYDESVNAEVLIFNGAPPLFTQDVTVSSIYNIQDYEVYEFTVDMGMFLGKEMIIEILNQDPNFGDYIWKSERINVVASLTNYLELRYYNSSNTNVIYSSGIQHLLRIPYNTIKAVDSDSNESYKTDTNTHLLNSDVYEITDFEFIPLPLELYRKLKIALSMDNVFIDGTGYTKNAEFQKENLGSTNLYKLTAAMVKNGFVFNSNMNVSQIITDENVNVPGLVQIGSNGYVAL